MNQLVSSGLQKAELIALPITLRDPRARVRRAGRGRRAAAARAHLGRGRDGRARDRLPHRRRGQHHGPGRGPDRPRRRHRLLAVLHPARTRRAAAGRRSRGGAGRLRRDRRPRDRGRRTTVIIGLAGLLFTGYAVFVSMALGAILVVAIAVLGSLTVLPATLALLGDKVDRGRLWRRRRAGRGARPAGRVWGRFARAITARPRLSLALALVLLAALAAPILSMHTARPGPPGRCRGTRRSASPSARSTAPSRAPTTPPSWSSPAIGSAPRRHGHGCSGSASRAAADRHAAGQVDVRVSATAGRRWSTSRSGPADQHRAPHRRRAALGARAGDAARAARRARAADR